MAIQSVETLAEAFEFIRKRGKLLGVDLFDESYKPLNFITFIVILDIITYAMVTVYCVFEFIEDLEKLVFCLVTFGFGVQGIAKLQTFWIGRKNMLILKDTMFAFHDVAWSTRSSQIFEKYSSYCVKASKFCNYLYAVCAVITLSNPLIIKLLTGTLVLPYGFKLPWIDEFTVIGYTINLLHHLLQDFFVATGYIYADALYAIIILNVYCIFDILTLMIEEIDQEIKVEKKGKNALSTKKKLIEMILLHQRLLRFDI